MLRQYRRSAGSLQVFEGELKGGLRQQDADELLPHVERQGSFRVADLSACDRRLIASGLQAPLPLAPAFEEVPDPDVKLLSLVQIFPGKILRTEEGHELGVSSKSRIRA